jgi:hypothetical protein
MSVITREETLQLTEVPIVAAARDSVSADRQRVFVAIALVVLAAVGAARIISTYHVFSQTYDEPAHLATGMEWLERGSYRLEPLHPPMARVAVALGPYLSGLRLTGQGKLWPEGNAILLAHHRYLHNLTLARLGVLPFFLLSTVLVWKWSRLRYGNSPALIATLLFTTSPVVLAHGGVATTDMALAATFTGALATYIGLLESPSYRQAAIFGVATGLAILSKFSALIFMPACGLAILVWRWLLQRGKKEQAAIPNRFRWRRGLSLAALVMFLVVWAGYRFSVGPLVDGSGPNSTIVHFFGTTGTLHDWASSLAGMQFPAPALFHGLNMLRQVTDGQRSYLLGQIRETGWWYFFPVALAVKTPLPFLVLIGIGGFYLGNCAWREKNWIIAAPLVAALALLLVCMPSRLNIGIRHILPIYPLLAIIGGVGACRLWNLPRPKYAGMTIVLVLLVWHLISSFRAHPDYLAYFNELAGQHPEKILVNSDLDWGQDLFRLSAVLRTKGVDKVSIAYFGTAALDSFDLPPSQELSPYQPTTGWIAISQSCLKMGGVEARIPPDSFHWLEAYKPVGMAGRSILLYYVADSAGEEKKVVFPNQVTHHR